MELPLDVTLESDGDNHVDPKAISTDDDQSIPGECKNVFLDIHRITDVILMNVLVIAALLKQVFLFYIVLLLYFLKLCIKHTSFLRSLQSPS